MSAPQNLSVWRLETHCPGPFVFGAGASGEMRKYHVSTKECTSHPLCAGWINGLAYCPENDSLAASSSRGELFELDPATLDVRTHFQTDYWLNGIKNVKPNCYVLTTAEGRILYWNAKSNQVTIFNDCHSDQIWDCAVTEDTSVMATAGGKGELALWDIEHKQRTHLFSNSGHILTSVVMLEKQGLVATVDMGGMLILWNIQDGHAIYRFNAHDARIWSIATSSDQAHILTASADKRVVLWDVTSMHILQEYQLNIIPTACGFHEESQNIIIGDRAGVISSRNYGSLSSKSNIPGVILAKELQTNRFVAFLNTLGTDRTKNFSLKLKNILDQADVNYKIVEVGDRPFIQQSLARLSGCPLFPQLYVDGLFIGGSEIVSEMFESGAFHRLFINGTQTNLN